MGLFFAINAYKSRIMKKTFCEGSLKSIIVYGTRYGATKGTAEEIAKVLYAMPHYILRDCLERNLNQKIVFIC
jgi:hypothetical protein